MILFVNIFNSIVLTHSLLNFAVCWVVKITNKVNYGAGDNSTTLTAWPFIFLSLTLSQKIKYKKIFSCQKSYVGELPTKMEQEGLDLVSLVD